MSGYTPVFDSVLDGTLYGRWPHTGVWLCLLSQCNKKGEIDAVPELLAAKIGIPLQMLLDCIRDFMSPDPGSRCGDEEGRRLVLVDTARHWGWRVVNCMRYRRLASGASQVEDGRNAEKVRRYKERKNQQDTAGHPQTPQTPTHTHTQTHTHTETQTKIRGDARGEARATRSPANRLPIDFNLTEDRKAYATAQGIDPARTFENFRDYWTAASGAKARKHDWDATWRMWCRNQSERKIQGSRSRKTRFEELTEHLNVD